MLGHFLNLHTDINGIPVLVSNCKNTNRSESIAFGVSGSQILRQGVVNIHEGIIDEKWRRAVAKLVGAFLKQDVPEESLTACERFVSIIATSCRDLEVLPIHGVVSILELKFLPTPTEHKTIQNHHVGPDPVSGW